MSAFIPLTNRNDGIVEIVNTDHIERAWGQCDADPYAAYGAGAFLCVTFVGSAQLHRYVPVHEDGSLWVDAAADDTAGIAAAFHVHATAAMGRGHPRV